MALLMSPECKSWNLIIMGGLEHASPANVIFLFIAEVKTHWKVILTCYLKNWMQKYKDKWSPNCLLWKRQMHSQMKQSISCPGAPCTSMASRPLMMPSILANFSNGTKFRNCTYWLNNDIQSHCFPCWVSNHHIDNENLVLLGHVDIDS